MKKPRMREVVETNLGVYVWKMPNGQILGDDDGNYLSIASVKDDRAKISNITKVAHSVLRGNGIQACGEPFFMPGSRKVSDAEYVEQKERMASGLIPDEFDLASMKETLRRERRTL
jgi:hypothetical protein